MKTAVIYGRVSSRGQAEEELPIDSQMERGREKAAAMEAMVLREFVDGGISGRSDERPSFQAAIAYCALYNVDYFITWSTSRFARNKLDAALYKRELLKSNTQMVYVSQDFDSKTDSGWMMESMLEIFDEMVSRQTASDTRRSMMKNARDGYWNGGHAPYGYSVVLEGKRRKLQLCPTESVTVRRIFRLAASEVGAREIARQLNADGLTRRGKPWMKTTVAYLLGSPIYAGCIVFNRVGANGHARPSTEWIMTPSHTPIIEFSEWESLQLAIGARAPIRDRGSAKSTHAFTGMLKCGACGGSMMIETATGRSRTYSYYNCATWMRGGKCASRRIAADDLDEWLEGRILDAILTRSAVEKIIAQIDAVAGRWAVDQQNKLKVIDAELRDVERRYGKLMDVLELQGRDAPNLGDLTERMRDLKQRKSTLQREAQRIESEPEPRLKLSEQQLADADQLVRSIVMNCKDASKRRSFYASFVEEVVLQEGVAKVSYRPEALIATMTAGKAVHSGENWLLDLGSNQGPTD